MCIFDIFSVNIKILSSYDYVARGKYLVITEIFLTKYGQEE